MIILLVGFSFFFYIKYMKIFLACSVHILTNSTFIVETKEESGEQCIVVFALIVAEPASECVCVATQPITRRLRNN